MASTLQNEQLRVRRAVMDAAWEAYSKHPMTDIQSFENGAWEEYTGTTLWDLPKDEYYERGKKFMQRYKKENKL
ncbi:MAG: hypothetical protein IIZ78_06030 [Clostridiales bacterium]|nr:hypothetical protein [Clostridiales bacterium]